MPKAKPQLIANRFELITIVLICFVVSNRLIWLHVDQPLQAITGEFYSTALSFNRTLSQYCRIPVAPNFPQTEPDMALLISPIKAFSPGLALTFLGLCQLDRLHGGSFTSLAPQLITASAFMTAITARILTSSWVGGILAAAVVLSRGTVLAAVDHAGTFALLQPTLCIFFLLLTIYARTGGQSWLNVGWVFLLASVLISPLMAIAILPVLALLGTQRQTAGELKGKALTWQRFSILVGTLLLLLTLLHKYTPSSLSGVTLVRDHILICFRNGVIFKDLIVPTWKHLANADLHWQLSIGAIAIAAVLSRYFPIGAALTLRVLLIMVGLTSLIDGILSKNELPAAESSVLAWIATGLDPILLGLGAGVTWHALRLLLMAMFTDYSRSPAPRDNMEGET